MPYKRELFKSGFCIGFGCSIIPIFLPAGPYVLAFSGGGIQGKNPIDLQKNQDSFFNGYLMGTGAGIAMWGLAGYGLWRRYFRKRKQL